ncbi:MAG: DHA2 family efflux MFS transporter permease subunit [Alphaproteobacteria bacterium]|jgi:DHA2 family multidrug resistance protein|nr:DHA2 family efflux MFS transporter permease subunit [Alphaproteobacteria bacterium]
MTSKDAAVGTTIRVSPWLILATTTLTSTLYGMSVTIANVSLPQLQGALAATQDQIAWTVTFNIVGTAVVTPLTGWLTARLGQRRLMLWSVAGFTISSMLCGFAYSLEELVFYRVFQGAFGAPLVPLGQAIVLGVFPRRLHTVATAIWGMGVVFGPVIGPTIGGYLTEAFDWRWSFYVIAPFSALGLAGAWLCIHDLGSRTAQRLDWTGFLALSIAIAAMQLMLDRGQRLDWFQSPEIVLEAAVAALCFHVFVVHVLTTRTPYLNPALFRDRNYTMGAVLVFIYGMLNFTPMVLYPPMLQDLRGYPESIIGLLLAARGVGALLGNVATVWISRNRPRLGLALGFVAQSASCWMLAGFDINMTTEGVAWASFIQGFGVGLSWVPLTVIMFSNTPAAYLPEGTAVLHLLRNISSSIYISMTVALVTRSATVNYSTMGGWVSPYNELLNYPFVIGAWSLQSADGLARLSGEIERQAAMIGYINAFYLLGVTGLVSLPFILLIKTSALNR